MTKKIIFSILLSATLVLGAVYAPRISSIKVPQVWRGLKTYKDSSIGISFKYPSFLAQDTQSGNSILFDSHENGVYQAIKVDRLFGFGVEKTTESVFKILKLDTEPVKEKIQVGGNDAILVTELHDSTQHKLYILVDDSLFIISLYNVDPIAFYKSLSFDGVQILSDYRTENISTSTKRFTNLKYHYQITIPNYFGYVVADSSVYFATPFDGPGPGIGIYASTTSFLNRTNFGIAPPSLGVFETEILIDGVKADITHAGSKEVEEFPEYKDVRFEKNGIYFDVHTQYIDHDAVWKSFKFIDE